MRLLEPFRPFLPSDATLTDEKVGTLYLAKIFAGEKLIGQALDSDVRTASLSAIGTAIANFWPEQIASLEPHLSWGFGVAAEVARQSAINRAVRRWAWAMWMAKSLPMEENERLPRELEGFSAFGAGSVKQMTCWQHGLSFFEPNSAIHQLNFTVAICKSEIGWLVGSAVTRKHESPVPPIWQDFFIHLAMLRDSDQVMADANWKRRLMTVRGVDLKGALSAWQGEGEWPAFRMDQSFDHALGEVGHLWAARVEGVGQAIGESGELNLCD